ncbi:MAG: hypothetical protein R3189_07145 [Thiomicrorhabdus chilensis]|uniref:hypothetical protein n=1 Tax=Thiomicrorhabdus chilensis TaxID=63656 RepID=UPI00299DCD55|nr:hypothetical protein [Thiomicrorhabdus chilensis]MDX1348008.1 hypothetical protein [Thiomicrorhabdus chilensis]
MMSLKSFKPLMLAALFVLPASVMAMEEEPVYGSQLMTQQERQEHQAKMRAAQSEEEREQIREEHHEQMQIRAEEKGVDLPDEPPAERGHMNQHDRPGMGYGRD